MLVNNCCACLLETASRHLPSDSVARRQDDVWHDTPSQTEQANRASSAHVAALQAQGEICHAEPRKYHCGSGLGVISNGVGWHILLAESTVLWLWQCVIVNRGCFNQCRFPVLGVIKMMWWDHSKLAGCWDSSSLWTSVCCHDHSLVVALCCCSGHMIVSHLMCHFHHHGSFDLTMLCIHGCNQEAPTVKCGPSLCWQFVCKETLTQIALLFSNTRRHQQNESKWNFAQRDKQMQCGGAAVMFVVASPSTWLLGVQPAINCFAGFANVVCTDSRLSGDCNSP